MNQPGMDMTKFGEKFSQVSANSGTEYSDIPKMVVRNGIMVRIVGDFQSIHEHFITMPAGMRPFYCDGPDSDCPICAAAMSMAVGDDAEKQSIAKSIKAKEKFYFNVLDRSPVGKQAHLQSRQSFILCQNEKGMSIGSQLFQAIGQVVGMRQQQGQPADPTTFDIMITKSGTGMQTKYGAQFTGDDTPLDEAEQGYKLHPLHEIAVVTPFIERKAVSDYLLGSAMPPQAAPPQAAPPQAAPPQAAPPQAAPPQAAPPQAAPPQAAPPQAAPPQAAPPQAAPPQAAPPQAAPQKLVMKPIIKKDDLQDATPNRSVDMSTHMEVPCSQCNSEMLFSMEDTRNFKCSNCGHLYSHPNNS